MVGGLLNIQSSRLSRGCKNLIFRFWLKVGIACLQASLVKENAGDWMFKLVPACSLATKQSKQCKWLCMETSGGGEDRFLKPFGRLAFFSEARKHLSYSLWLKACIAKLVISLATCHTSTPEDGGMEMFGFAVSNRTQCPPHWAYTPWLEGGWVSKACLWKRELNWHCKVSLLESWHCPPLNEPGQKKCRGLNINWG